MLFEYFFSINLNNSYFIKDADIKASHKVNTFKLTLKIHDYIVIIYYTEGIRIMQKEILTLNILPLGQSGIIQTVGGEGILRRRLLDMGLTPRTKVMVRKKAPLGDPLEIFLRGYELTLRADEAAKITVLPEGDDK